MSTNYQAKYFAHDLTRQASREGLDRLSMALFDANVDLNPHQIDAALFALRSPLLKGVILADEVGLGKTIEASLILGQLWAERKRRLLVICPASIRKQWATELEEKFNLPSVILDRRSYMQASKEGSANPFATDKVVICSMNFAAKMKDDLRAVGWHVAVIDEAHKLRNAHQTSNKTGQAIRWALGDSFKVLLTATPLQNSLMELYGMSSIIDEFLFGDPGSFRAMYGGGNEAEMQDLKLRLAGFCKRTLRKDVLEYVQYTKRHSLTQRFSASDEEHKLYEAVSAFLQEPDTFSVPHRQKTLITLRLRKILASSSHAITGTLETIRDRLIALRDGLPPVDLVDKIIAGEDLDDDDLTEEQLDIEGEDNSENEIDPQKLKDEIFTLETFIMWARGIAVDTKSRSLINALRTGFTKMEERGAARKALIFTESRRTQTYLRSFLEANGYAGKIVLFNGSNNDDETKLIFSRWQEENKGTGRVTGSRDVDVRTALIDHFRDSAEIMIATEAAAEGVNLQFCSMIVNYDLPWNPQRIEQRIGRCHRYGQKHDVVVVNFVNERNEADTRTFELLESKFALFDGLFGASDEVLGTIESGVDFERRILNIHQTCRDPKQIEAAFEALRKELEDSIKARMTATRQLLLEFFDEELHERLRIQLDGAKQQLDRFGRQFWAVSQHVLKDRAEFVDKDWTFRLEDSPIDEAHQGTYRLISKQHDNVDGMFLYRLSHPLGEWVVDQAKRLETPTALVEFDVTNHPSKISIVEELKGHCGWLSADKLTIDTFDQEEHILLSGLDEEGGSIDHEVLEKMLTCPARVLALEENSPSRLTEESMQHQKAVMHRSFEANSRFMNEERERLERWADDMVLAAEKELKDVKAQLRTANSEARKATTTEEQVSLQTKIRDLEQRQRRQRQRIFEIEDEIIDKRNQLISALEKRMRQRTGVENLFTIRWSVI